MISLFSQIKRLWTRFGIKEMKKVLSTGKHKIGGWEK